LSVRSAALLLVAGCVGAVDVITPSDVNMMATLADGRVLLAGGNTGGPALTTCMGFDPDAGAWTPLDGFATGRSRGTLTLLPDRTLLAVGGFDGLGGSVAQAERYDPGTGHWSSAGAQPIGTQQHSATLLADGTVIVIGGLTSTDLSTPQVLRYAPTTGSWTSRAAMIHPRHDHAAVLLPSGKILCIGGYVNSGAGNGPVATVDVYSPATDSWASAAPMSTARFNHTAALLPDGNVAAFGGNDGSGLATMEIYHPGTNTWSTATAMPHIHDGVGLVQLYDGKVLLLGGYNQNADLYDPAGGTWTSPTCIAMAQPRSLDPIGLAGDGRVVIAAGIGSGMAACGDAEVFGQHLDFAAIPAHQVGDPPIALAASSSAGLPVTFTVLSGPATVSGSSLTITGPGTVLVRAEQPGDATWFPAARLRSFTVSAGGGSSGGSSSGAGSSSGGSGGAGSTTSSDPSGHTQNFFCGLGAGTAGLIALALAGLLAQKRRR
jgi:N-acetylneuraminic acid mutarotase